MGGMFGESKFEVLQKVPVECKPKSVLIEYPARLETIVERMRTSAISFPVICKPDLGERGWMVRRVNNESELELYHSQIRTPFLVQELVDLPLEFGVFYVRYPSELNGRVTSIVGKEMLSVVGDGIKTLKELILEMDRAKLHWDTLRVTYRHCLKEILPPGKKMELVSIGNHCLGTKFLNANYLITPTLSASFDAISKRIDGFCFGRYDLRVSTLKELEEGKVMLLELNGCGAEPAHIYQPGFSLIEACRVLFRHWSDIYRVSVENHKRGTPYLPLREARAIYSKFKSATRS